MAPALSSTSRRKSHYRGKEIRKREKGVDAFACNQVRLLLAGFGYQIMHVHVLERVTGTGWSLRRLAERVTPARFTVGRRITIQEAPRRTGACSPAGLRARAPRPRVPSAGERLKPNNYSFRTRNACFWPPEPPRPALAGCEAPHLTLDPEVRE